MAARVGRSGRRSGNGDDLVNSNEMAWMAALAENTDSQRPEADLYSQCSVCHGDKMAGAPPPFRPLVGIAGRLRPDQITGTIKSGKGRMPGFPKSVRRTLIELVDFLTNGRHK